MAPVTRESTVFERSLASTQAMFADRLARTRSGMESRGEDTGFWDAGEKLSESLKAEGFTAEYIPFTSFRGLLGDSWVRAPKSEITRLSPDDLDVVRFVGGIIANSDFRMPTDVEDHKFALAKVSLGFMQGMIQQTSSNVETV